MKLNVTINSTETRTGAKGRYSIGKATINKKDGSERSMTFMAFGAQRDSVLRKLRSGATLDLTCAFDGGVLKILGPDTGAVRAAEAA